MSVHWHDSNDRLDSVRRLVESLPDPESVRRYNDMPHSYVCERLAEADAEIGLNLREIQTLRERVRDAGLDYLRSQCRVQELEEELERPKPRWRIPWRHVRDVLVCGGIVVGTAVLVRGLIYGYVWAIVHLTGAGQ